jgi:hypothetical protein
VTFITDGDQQFTCGSGSARRNDQKQNGSSTGNNNDNGHEDDNDSERKAQLLARTLNNTVVHRTSGEEMRVQFVDKIEDDTADSESRQNDDSSEEETEPEPRSRRTRRERRSRRSRQARAQSARNHIPARLRKYLVEPEVPEAETSPDQATTASARGQAARSLLARPAAGLVDFSEDRRVRAARRAAALQSTAPDADAAAAKPATWWWFDWGHGGSEPET